MTHCSSTQNNVVVSEANEAGFCDIRTLKLVQTREEGPEAGQTAQVQTMPNGVPMLLTQTQAYEGAVKNGWSINE